MKQSPTNETTTLILKHLFNRRIFAWRNSVGGIKTDHGFYQFGKSGSPDIIAILDGGVFFGCEIKTKKDRMSELQKSFHLQAKQRGAIMFVVKNYQDFLLQWQNLKRE
jgi:hypothetical protein